MTAEGLKRISVILLAVGVVMFLAVMNVVFAVKSIQE